MKSKREEAAVGLFILIAVALLIGTGLAKSVFSSGGISHYAYFKTAGGINEGAKVRYGGMNAGKVTRVRVDPQDSTRIEIDFAVQKNIPVKVDSIVKVASLSALGENCLEIGTGTKDAAPSPPGSGLKSAESVTIADLGEVFGGLAPDAKQVLANLNQRLIELQETETRVNDLLNDKNRAAVSASLGNVNSILSDTRPKLAATMTSVQTASAQFQPTMDNMNATLDHLNDVLSNANSLVGDNRQDIRDSVVKVKQSLDSVSLLLEKANNITDNNADNIDQILVNVRVTTENVKELTDSLKKNPSRMVWGQAVKDRKPGDPGK